MSSKGKLVAFRLEWPDGTGRKRPRFLDLEDLSEFLEELSETGCRLPTMQPLFSDGYKQEFLTLDEAYRALGCLPKQRKST